MIFILLIERLSKGTFYIIFYFCFLFCVVVNLSGKEVIIRSHIKLVGSVSAAPSYYLPY